MVCNNKVSCIFQGRSGLPGLKGDSGTKGQKGELASGVSLNVALANLNI